MEEQFQLFEVIFHFLSAFAVDVSLDIKDRLVNFRLVIGQNAFGDLPEHVSRLHSL